MRAVVEGGCVTEPLKNTKNGSLSNVVKGSSKVVGKGRAGKYC